MLMYMYVCVFIFNQGWHEKTVGLYQRFFALTQYVQVVLLFHEHLRINKFFSSNAYYK